jgi:hypothetical protein
MLDVRAHDLLQVPRPTIRSRSRHSRRTWTEHAFVGAGDGPCVILLVGAHLGAEVRYPVSDLAARYGASVEKETSDPGQVYAMAQRFRRERPPYWARLPWA